MKVSVTVYTASVAGMSLGPQTRTAYSSTRRLVGVSLYIPSLACYKFSIKRLALCCIAHFQSSC